MGTVLPLHNAVKRFEEFLKNDRNKESGKKERIDFNEISPQMLERMVTHCQTKGYKKTASQTI
jgi:hypothetical protein